MPLVNAMNWTAVQHNILSVATNRSLTNIAPSTSGLALVSNGISAAPSFQLISVGFALNYQIFTYTGSTQTYNPTSGCVAAFVTCVAGGSGGAGCAAGGNGTLAASSGGGGGGVAMSWISSPVTETITIGVGGTGGSFSANGGAGGNTSYSNIVVAKAGGVGQNTDIHAGGSTPAAAYATQTAPNVLTGTAGQVIFSGGGGGNGTAIFIASGVLFSQGGAGGSSLFGAGAAAGFGTADTLSGTGASASNYGGGGGGAWSCTNGSNVSGGAGANGICIILEVIT